MVHLDQPGVLGGLEVGAPPSAQTQCVVENRTGPPGRGDEQQCLAGRVWQPDELAPVRAHQPGRELERLVEEDRAVRFGHLQQGQRVPAGGGPHRRGQGPAVRGEAPGVVEVQPGEVDPVEGVQPPLDGVRGVGFGPGREHDREALAVHPLQGEEEGVQGR